MCRITRGQGPRRNTKIAAIDLFPCGLWESPQEPGKQLSRVSCGPSMETPIEESANETKAMQCAEKPWPRPKLSAIDLVACGLWHPNGVQETRHPRSQASPAVWGTRPLVISATMGQATLAAGAEVAMCRITNSQGPRGNKHCCHRPLSWWSLGLSIDLCPCGRWESQ